jgi:hypothetical protein
MAVPEYTRIVFLAYFLTHIPATLLIDAQVLLPARLVPRFAQSLLQWHISTNNDVLMANQPPWLRIFVACELVFQLPFFFVASHAIWKRRNDLNGWFIAYGAHTATTLAPIAQYILEYPGLSVRDKCALVGIYAPYLVVPLWIVWVMLTDGAPFAKKTKTVSTKTKKTR